MPHLPDVPPNVKRRKQLDAENERKAFDAYTARLMENAKRRQEAAGQGSILPMLGGIISHIAGIPERAIEGAMGTVGPGGVITSADAPEAWTGMTEAAYDAAELLAGTGATRSMANAMRGVGGVELGAGGGRGTLIKGPQISREVYERSQKTGKAAKRLPASVKGVRSEIGDVRKLRQEQAPGVDPLIGNARTRELRLAEARRVNKFVQFGAEADWNKAFRKRVLDMARYDPQGAEREARRATMEAVSRRLRSLGFEERHQSKHGGRASSRYFVKNGREIRVSDHDIPMTAEREGRSYKWDELIVDPDMSVDDQLSEFIEQPLNRKVLGAGGGRTIYKVVGKDVPANEAFRPKSGRGVYAFSDERAAREFQKYSGGKIVSAKIDDYGIPEKIDDFSIEMFPDGNASVAVNKGDSGLYPAGQQLYVRDSNLIDPTTAVDEALNRKVLDRGKSGRPLKSERLPIGKEKAIIDESLRKMGIDPAKVPDEAKKGITVFHGSPHDFDKFSLEKIGTGEGAQAYGHGLYFAERPEVSETYRYVNQPAYAGSIPQQHATRALKSAHRAGFSGNEAKKEAKKYLNEYAQQAGQSDLRQQYYDAMNNFDELTSGDIGRMYEARLNASPDEFLDWDKPLSEQPEAIRKAIFKAGGSPERNLAYGEMRDKYIAPMRELMKNTEFGRFVTAEDILDGRANIAAIEQALANDPKRWAAIKRLRAAFENDPKAFENQDWSLPGKWAYYKLTESGASPQNVGVGGPGGGFGGVADSRLEPEATELLRAAGVKGIKYLDAGSRQGGKGTYNYVVFDENIIEIMRKFGIAGATIGAAGAVAASGGGKAEAKPRKKSIMEGN